MKPDGKLFCATRTDADSRLDHATKIREATWYVDSLGADAPSCHEAGMNMLFLSQDEAKALFADFTDVQVGRMTITHGTFRDDDWLIYAKRGL